MRTVSQNPRYTLGGDRVPLLQGSPRRARARLFERFGEKNRRTELPRKLWFRRLCE
jgi:hypothetical protein